MCCTSVGNLDVTVTESVGRKPQQFMLGRAEECPAAKMCAILRRREPEMRVGAK